MRVIDAIGTGNLNLIWESPSYSKESYLLVQIFKKRFQGKMSKVGLTKP